MLALKMERPIMAALILFAGLSLAQESHAVLSSTPPEQASAGTDDGKRVLNFGPTSGMKTADLDDPNSALSKKIAFIVKGNGKPSKYVSIVNVDRDTRIQVAIKDDSIFLPGNDPSNAQHGFR